jgi:hypothetical protein
VTAATSGRVAPRALPDPPPPEPPRDLISVLRPLLPPRSALDVIAARAQFQLGDRTVALPVLPIRKNRAWKEKLAEQVGLGLAFVGRDTDAQGVLNALSGMTDVQLGLLTAYDQTGVLPDRDWIEDHVTEAQLLTAFLTVIAAAFPFVATPLVLLLESDDLQASLRRLIALPEVQAAMRRAFSESTNGAQPSTAGLPDESMTT